jgi:CDP-diacylglycerol--serine O-phosphatidyltransferase
MIKFIGLYNVPLLITVLGIFSALWACLLSFNDKFEFAVIFFILAGLCDLFDGVVARKLKMTEEEKKFGLYIDSIADAVSFGLAPVIILLHSGFNSNLDYLLFSFYCFSASIRLAYFNLLQERNDKPTTYYTGLPVTYAALILPIVFTIGVFLDESIANVLVRFSLFLLGFFFILKVPIKKPDGIFYIIFPLLGAALILFWLKMAFN